MNSSAIPLENDNLALFEYSVRKVIELGRMNEKNTHQVWANLIFKYEKRPDKRSELMSKIKHEYSAYFDEELHYKFLEEKIRNNFPYLFGIEEDLSLYECMILALERECEEQRSPRNKKSYKVDHCDKIHSEEGKYLYQARLSINEGDDPHFSEGLPFDYKTQSNSNERQALTFHCEVVEYDYANAILFFSSSRPIGSAWESRVVVDATMNTIALIKHLKEISYSNLADSLPIQKFINETTRNLSKVEHNQAPEYLREILNGDTSQQRAYDAALSNDITFIWGPPGTGKSFTLAVIIMALYKMKGERTAVCCLSNVAVDQLVNKVVAIIEENEPGMPRGEFYRAGRTQDDTLLKTDFLYPDDESSKRLRGEIRSRSEQIEKYKNSGELYSEDAIRLKAARKDLREELKLHTDYLIGRVRVVFSTIANFVINPRLKDGEFDNLIVDEASMLALPQLIALSKNVAKRIILVGDFQQLSPITMTGLPVLKNNVFKCCGIDINHSDHPALHQLLNQRRSNPKLVEVVNGAFYDNRLNAKNIKYHKVVARPPFSECVIGMVCVTDGAVRFTKGDTRQNVKNAENVMNLLDMYSKDKEEDFSIGIITPYEGQVSLLKARFIEKGYDADFQDRVRMGTVHTFQGSESDVIIFDLVDCSRFEKGRNAYFGKIYQGEQGEQLLNVAISRAKHKLIIICDPDFISQCPGNVVSFKSRRIFDKLLQYRNTQI